MTPAAAWDAKCATVGCQNERRPGGRQCVPCTLALRALPPVERMTTMGRSPELFDEPVAEPAPAPVGRSRKPRARATDPATSHGAAARADRGLTGKQRAVLAIFRELGRMHDELLITLYRERRLEQLARGFGEQIPDMTDSSIRTRRAELVRLGHLRDTGHQATTAPGGPTTVWAAVVAEAAPAAPHDAAAPAAPESSAPTIADPA